MSLKSKDLSKMCSLEDMTELRQLIIDNPNLPLLIFCGPDAWTDTFPYEKAEVWSAKVEELTLYKDCWTNKEDYEDLLNSDLGREEKYCNLSEKDFDDMISKIVVETEFIKAIVIYVG